MAKSFTETEKRNIREKLIAECEKSWSILGYKKACFYPVSYAYNLCSAINLSSVERLILAPVPFDRAGTVQPVRQAWVMLWPSQSSTPISKKDF